MLKYKKFENQSHVEAVWKPTGMAPLCFDRKAPYHMFDSNKVRSSSVISYYIWCVPN